MRRGVLVATLVALAAIMLGAGVGAARADCVGPRDMAGVASAMLDEINRARRQAGRAALVASEPLARAAQDHACEMALRGEISHRGADGSSVFERITRRGYRPCFAAENVARGQSGVQAVMAAWMGSSGHRANLLNPRVQQVGVGVAFGAPGGARPNWVLVLADGC